MNAIQRRAIVWTLVAALVLLVATGVRLSLQRPSDGNLSFGVEGRVGSVPALRISDGLSRSDEGVHVLVQGKGRHLVAGEPALLRVFTFDQSGKLTSSDPTGALFLGKLGPDLVPHLSDRLQGLSEGSRAVVVTRDAKQFEIAVVDVLSTYPTGTVRERPQDAPVWVTQPLGAAELAEITPAKDLWGALVVAGLGHQVKEGDSVIAQYAIFDATDGKVRSSTWQAGGMPVKLDLNSALPAVKSELVDSRVGSRVVMMVPASGGDGDMPLVIVVDVLAVLEKG